MRNEGKYDAALGPKLNKVITFHKTKPHLWDYTRMLFHKLNWNQACLDKNTIRKSDFSTSATSKAIYNCNIY